MKILTVAFMLLFNYLDALPKLYDILPTLHTGFILNGCANTKEQCVNIFGDIR